MFRFEEAACQLFGPLRFLVDRKKTGWSVQRIVSSGLATFEFLRSLLIHLFTDSRNSLTVSFGSLLRLEIARDQAGATVESEICPGPLKEYGEPVSKTDQENDMNK